MLVFRRQTGESFHIGEEVEVRVLEISRGKVKIGVIAPRSVEIYRSEIAGLNRRALLRDRGAPAVEASLRDLAARLRKAPKPK